MVRSTLRAGGLVSLALLGACSAGTPPPAPAPAPVPAAEPSKEREGPTTADGIYTAAQAERGNEVYVRVCSECHHEEDFNESAFRSRWEDKSVFQLWYWIHDRMPYGAPSSLTRQQYTDVLAFILSLNGLPAGSEELGADDDSLDNYWVAWGR